MDVQKNHENPNESKLSLHRIYQKNSSFESFSVNVDSLKNPVVSPVLDMQIFANAYAQGNDIHHAVLGLKIDAKHNGDLVWRLQLEMAGFYSLEGFSEEQQRNILNGYCMNQLYSHSAVLVTQMVTQGGFSPIYLQSMDFNRMHQEQKKESLAKESLARENPESSEILSKRLNAVKQMHVTEPLLN